LNLDYDFAIITGKRKLTRTAPLYIACRWCTLVIVILQFLSFDAPQLLDCQALVTGLFTFGTFSYLFGSPLILLRIYALWQGNRVVVAITSTFWLANAVTYVYAIATTSGRRVGGFCRVGHILRTRLFIFSTFLSDLVFLAFMLAGVLRWKEPRMKGGIWWLLYTQGLAWVVAFALADVPPVVFIFLNLNDAMNRMFPFPSLIVMAIAALRTYQGLVNSTTYNGSPMIEIAVEERPAGEQHQSSGFPNSSRAAEGTHSTGLKFYASTRDTHSELEIPQDDKSLEGEIV